jgi:hypothetical protein
MPRPTIACGLFIMTLVACAPARLPEARADVRFVPDARGLAVDPAGMRVDFGRAPSGVIAALDRELGPGRALPVSGCPAGVVQQIAWGDLALSFARERFVGWRDANGSAGMVCAPV